MTDENQPAHNERPATLHDYLAVIRRRRLTLVATVLGAVVLAIVFSLTQEERYQGTADVLLSRQNLAASLTQTIDPAGNVSADRFAQTQAEVATSPEVAARTLRALDVEGMTPGELTNRTRVVPKQNADVLRIAITADTAKLAAALTTEYARRFTEYRRELDTSALLKARRDVRSRLEDLRQRGFTDNLLYEDLRRRDQQLATLETLQTSNAFLVRPALSAARIQPKPKRNVLLALIAGTVLGIGLAFLRDALDRRVRSGEEIARALGAPILSWIPRIESGGPNKLVMLEDPMDPAAEAFRLLRTNLAFARLDGRIRRVAVASSIEEEGKSVTICNLAVALARAGESVVLVDLDLRRPRVQSMFGLDGPGLTDVALGRASLDEAIVDIPLERTANIHRTTGGEIGSLRVLPAGFIPPDPGEFIASERLAELLDLIGERYGRTMLVDAPPILRVGDAIALSSKVDAMLYVARLKVVRRPMLPEVHRLLDALPIPLLGIVINGVDQVDSAGGYGYGYGYGYGDPPISAHTREFESDSEGTRLSRA